MKKVIIQTILCLVTITAQAQETVNMPDGSTMVCYKFGTIVQCY